MTYTCRRSGFQKICIKFLNNQECQRIVTSLVIRHGFGLVTGLIGLFKLVTTNNYSVLTNLHQLFLITTLAKSSISSPVVPW
jgi:hypothetical protein